MNTPKFQKSHTLFDAFTRKENHQNITHYCPGCGHGVAHNLIAEAIDKLGVQNDTIFCSPVGCAVFGYYYFDTGNIQCAHGRAPAVASAIRRVHPKSIIISYQGDGDLAGIGLSHILHAANRNENITVFFINNAIYGMTGGQMAPTTLLGQKTVTTPDGRDILNDGAPIHICELISQLNACYVERVSLADPSRIAHARKAIHKALQNQVEGKGFSLVEILSPCPINWKMTPVKARQWMIESLEKTFPLQCFKDISAERAAHSATPKTTESLSDTELFKRLDITFDADPVPPRIPPQKVVIAGFGGQGVLTAGKILAECALQKGLYTSWVPSYGPEMRGGNAFVTVNIENSPILSPITENPNVLIAMSEDALTHYIDKLPANALLIMNSSLIPPVTTRDDLQIYAINATQIANTMNAPGVVSTLMLTSYALIREIISIDELKHTLKENLKHPELLNANMRAIAKAIEIFEQQKI